MGLAVTSPDPFPLNLWQSLNLPERFRDCGGDTRVKPDGLVSGALLSEENLFSSG